MHTVMMRGLLLKAVPYGEADVVATLLTEEAGLLSALARSARKSRKRFGAAFDFYNLLGLEVKPSRAGLSSLVSVELIRSFGRAASDVDAYFALGRMLEIARLASREGEGHSSQYALLLSALKAVEEGAKPGETLRLYQLKTISSLGYSLGGTVCAACGEILSGGSSYRAGAPHCVGCGGEKSVEVSAGARKTILAAEKAQFGKLRITEAVDGEIGPVVEEALAHALGTG